MTDPFDVDDAKPQAEHRVIFVGPGPAGDSAIDKATADGWQVVERQRINSKRDRVDLKRGASVTDADREEARAQVASIPKGSGFELALGVAIAAAVVGGIIWGAIAIFTGSGDDQPAVASPPTTTQSTDTGRCARIGGDWSEYKTKALDPLIALGPSGISAASFAAIIPETKTINNSIEKWSTGMRDSELASAWTSALGYGRRAAIVFAGSDVSASQDALTAFANASNAAFDKCRSA